MMEIQRKFVKAVVSLAVVAFVFFTIEFVVEWNRLDKPDSDKSSTYAGVNDNVKMVDVLSPVARAYNNMLAMLIAAVGLAIPITANMHTPKLIEMFLRDPVNRCMLVIGAVGAAHVLWVAYLIGPGFAPVWSYRIAIYGAMLGWIVLIPYFFYAIRFLDPSHILARLKAQVLRDVERARHGKNEIGPAHDDVRDLLRHIGTIVLKSIDRGDRGVAAEGVWCFKQLLDHYRRHKAQLPPAWFHVERRDIVGLSVEGLELLNKDGTWLEHAALWQMYLVYLSALTKAPDTLSALSDTVRVIGVHAAVDGDEKVLELVVRIFNNFVREAIKRRDMHAIYDVLHQYRRLGMELDSRPALLERIAGYMRYYAGMSVAVGMDFVAQMMVFDLGLLVERAFEKDSPAGPTLLREVLAIRHENAAGPLLLGVKGKAIIGSRLLETGHASEANLVRDALRSVPAETLQRAEHDLLAVGDRVFWELTDRQVNFEWVPPERRPGLQRFFALMNGAPV